jgi:hypothetical protein
MAHESDSVRWEYTAVFADVGGTMTSTPLNIWDKKHKHLNNISYWEKIMGLGENGWEMISASPWCGKGDGLTTGMLFVFKRQTTRK